MPVGAAGSTVTAASTPRSARAAADRPAREVVADAAVHPTRGPRPRPPDGRVGRRASRLQQHPAVHVSAALQGIGVDTDVEHDVAHAHQVHGAHPTGGLRRAQAPPTTGTGSVARRRARATPFSRANFFQSLLFVLSVRSVTICSTPMADQHGRRPPGSARIGPEGQRHERRELGGDRPAGVHPGTRIGVGPQVGAVIGLQPGPGRRRSAQEVVGPPDPDQVAHQPVGRRMHRQGPDRARRDQGEAFPQRRGPGVRGPDREPAHHHTQQQQQRCPPTREP